jgi:N-acyl-phosphatidylethanolamine-hydrolysing phospholipase D
MPEPHPLQTPRFAHGRYLTSWVNHENGLLDVLRWKLSAASRAAQKAKRRAGPPEIPQVENDGAYLLAGSPDLPPSVTWVGHATFAVQDEGQVFLTDPHWGPRAFLPPRLAPPGVPIEAVPAEGFVVLSHNHYDHLDAWTVRNLPKSLPWFVPLGLGSWLRRRGVAEVTELGWWQSVRHRGWTLTALPAQHWSNRLGMKKNGSLWCSWMVESASRRYYFGGDSGYFPGFGEIGRRFPKIDVALLPIGAYEPRWFMREAHMNPEDALRAFRDLGAERMIPTHWGGFDLTDEPADEPPKVLRRLLEGAPEAGRVTIPAVGERVFL